MDIKLSVVTLDMDELNDRVPEKLTSFELEDLFENVDYETGMIFRLETRIRAVARLAGVGEGCVEFELVDFEGHDITPNGDAIEKAQDVAQFWNWVTDKREWDYLPIIARLVGDNWKYINTGDLNRELEDYFVQFDAGEYDELAQGLVRDGLIEAPGEEWDSYIDWTAKGEDIASGYSEYDYGFVTYLFHS